jgi:hypothetical protein
VHLHGPDGTRFSEGGFALTDGADVGGNIVEVAEARFGLFYSVAGHLFVYVHVWHLFHSVDWVDEDGGWD